jgi:hypothetical protein
MIKGALSPTDEVLFFDKGNTHERMLAQQETMINLTEPLNSMTTERWCTSTITIREPGGSETYPSSNFVPGAEQDSARYVSCCHFALNIHNEPIGNHFQFFRVSFSRERKRRVFSRYISPNRVFRSSLPNGSLVTRVSKESECLSCGYLLSY